MARSVEVSTDENRSERVSDSTSSSSSTSSSFSSDSVGLGNPTGHSHDGPVPVASTSPDESGDVSITDSADASHDSPVVSESFVLGRSRVDHKQIQDFVNRGYLKTDSLGRSQFRPPGNETVP